MTTSAIFGEQYLSKVGAVFDDAEQAQQAAERMTRQTGIQAAQVRVIEPDDPRMSSKLEPETKGIFRTIARAHITLGIAGLVVGVLIALVLIIGGFGAFSRNPWYALGVLGFFGAIAGLLLGGLVSLRPDHDRLIAWVKEAARGGHWFVLVHARNHEEERKAKEALNAMSDKVVGTF
jgi:hypothetical protein